MNTQVQVYYSPEPIVTLGRAQAAQISYMGLRSWAMQGMAQAKAVTVPFETHPKIVQEAITDAVSIMAAHALASALGKLEVIETCGRVTLVAVEERHVQRDPIIPLALMNLGHEYNKAFANYVRHLAHYSTDQGWWNKAQRLCVKVIDALQKVAQVLSAEELSYLVVKLQVSLAWPQGQEVTYNPYA